MMITPGLLREMRRPPKLAELLDEDGVAQAFVYGPAFPLDDYVRIASLVDDGWVALTDEARGKVRARRAAEALRERSAEESDEATTEGLRFTDALYGADAEREADGLLLLALSPGSDNGNQGFEDALPRENRWRVFGHPSSSLSSSSSAPRTYDGLIIELNGALFDGGGRSTELVRQLFGEEELRESASVLVTARPEWAFETEAERERESRDGSLEDGDEEEDEDDAGSPEHKERGKESESETDSDDESKREKRGRSSRARPHPPKRQRSSGGEGPTRAGSSERASHLARLDAWTLRKRAKKLDLSGYSRLPKPELIAVILDPERNRRWPSCDAEMRALPLKELRERARRARIKGAGHLNKDKLCRALLGREGGSSD